MLSDAPSLWALQRELRRYEVSSPGRLEKDLAALLIDMAAAAAKASHALQIQSKNASTDKLAGFLVEALLCDPADVQDVDGSVGRLLSRLKAAGVHVPAAVAPIDLIARLVATIAAGMDTQVTMWRAWLGAGLKKPATSWTATETPQALRRTLNAIWCEDVPATAAAEAAATELADPPAAHVPSPAAPSSSDLDPALLDQYLPAAVAAAPGWSEKGSAWVAKRPHLARQLVKDYLQTQQ